MKWKQAMITIQKDSDDRKFLKVQIYSLLIDYIDLIVSLF